jgi:HK97 gp10 family phage protein
MATTIRLEGFRELEAELEKLATPAQRKASARRALRKAAEPLVEAAQGLAPRGDSNTLAPSISVGTRLSRRQAGMHRRMFANDRAAVEMFVGAGPLASAIAQEFGNRNHQAQPFMRPAFNAQSGQMLEALKAELWADISRAIARAERRAARQAARAG